MNLRMLPDHLVLDDVPVPEPAEPSWFRRLLPGEARIVEPDQRPPPGHRNNRRHVYDEHGLWVLEWHASGWITNVGALLGEPVDREPWHPAHPFEGEVWVNETRLHAGMVMTQLPLDGEWSFTWRRALHMAIARRDGHSVTFAMQPASDTFELVEVHYGYESPRLRSKRPRPT